MSLDMKNCTELFGPALALATVSQPIRSSPQEKPEPIEEPVDEFEQLDNEPEIERPRLSLPIQESEEEGEEASPEMQPPRMSFALVEEDMDMTYQSVEYPRDASIRDRDRLSMMSRATGRISGDFDETRLESDDADETGIVGEDDEAEDTLMSGGDFDRGLVYKIWIVYICDKSWLISQIGERRRI